MSADNALENVADNYVFIQVKKGNDPLIKKITLTTNSNVFESYAPYVSAAISEHLSQGSPIYLKTNKKYQSFIPKVKNPNYNTDVTVLKRSTINFNIKASRSMESLVFLTN